MANTHGFDLIIQTAESVINKALKGAWKSSDCPDQPDDTGRIPEFMDIAGGGDIGGFTITDGQIQIPQEELEASFSPDVNGVEITMGMNAQITIGNPPIPSAGLLDFHTKVTTKAPIGLLPDTQDVGILLKDILQTNVSAELDQGHPLDNILNDLLKEYIDTAYENEDIPHVITESNVPIGFGETMGITVQIFNDTSDPDRKIITSFTNATTLRVEIPIYLRMYAFIPNNGGLTAPMGIETKILIDVPFEKHLDKYIAKFADVTSHDVSVPVNTITGVDTDITATPNEATNYTNNKGIIPNLDSLIASQLEAKGVDFATNLGNQEVAIPSKNEIEAHIADIFFNELTSRQYIAIWSPSATDNEFQVDSVDVKVFNDSLNIALNDTGSGNLNAITYFIPNNMEFSIAMSSNALQEKIDQSIAENGFDSFPKRFEEDGKDVDLNSLNVSIVDHAIRLEGTVTVIDAVLGSIDVDASFRTDIGFHWTPNGALSSSGFQEMDHHEIGDSDVDVKEGVAFWIVAIILTIVSFGFGGPLIGIISIIVILIVKAIVENVGNESLVNGTTGTIEGITAWPPNLSYIGRVKAIFFDPIDISTTGLVISGQMEVISSCQSTQIVPATTAGKYLIKAKQSIQFKALKFYNHAEFFWNAGDGGNNQLFKDINHSYDLSGTYIAKHGVKVTEYGGASSRHFALVKVENVPPTVTITPEITVNEGEMVTLQAHFEDIEYADTHWSLWNFGDNHAPKKGDIEETNKKPKAIGSTTVKHAWCDNGVYHVSVQVIDNNGGIGVAHMKVNVLNVAPKVITTDTIYAYPCSPITLISQFTDPGWCDSHVGTWSFGDCSPTKMAVIKETNNAPEAKGVAIASHTYNKCGDYSAESIITDDHGAIGKSKTIVKVRTLKNAAFNDGFTYHTTGKIANFWTPFATVNKKDIKNNTDVEEAVTEIHSGITTLQTSYRENTSQALNDGYFFCEKCLVFDGGSAQRIRSHQRGFIGIYQQLDANVDWSYQVEAMYLIQQKPAKVRLGIDPNGDVNPDAPEIVWIEASVDQEWSHILHRICAKADKITIYLGVISSSKTPIDVCFDMVKVTAMQNINCKAVLDEVEPNECIDFKKVNPELIRNNKLYYKNVHFTSMGKESLYLDHSYTNDKCPSLYISKRGLLLQFDTPVSNLKLTVNYRDKLYIKTVSSDNSGNIVSTHESELSGLNKTFYVKGNSTKQVHLFITGNGALEKLCFNKKEDINSITSLIINQ